MLGPAHTRIDQAVRARVGYVTSDRPAHERRDREEIDLLGKHGMLRSAAPTGGPDTQAT